jgi:hypothetical protein
MNANFPDPSTLPQAPPKRRNTLVIVLLAGLVLLLCCCVAAAAVIVFADPFDLHIKDRLFGGIFDAAAEAMPENTSVYVGINLLNATPNELDRVIEPFADALDIDQRSWDEIIEELDRTIGNELENCEIASNAESQTWMKRHTRASPSISFRPNTAQESPFAVPAAWCCSA